MTIEVSEDIPPLEETDWVLREDQIGVVEAAVAYVRAKREAAQPAFGRIVMPPRTGKTVIAAKIMQEVRGCATFLAPTKVLVDQAAAEFRERLPGVSVWTLYSGSPVLGEDGIAVATYQSLQALAKSGEFPALVRRSTVVFADEAHHAMTEMRQEVLRVAFCDDAVRIALTATPDYDEERVLARHFPDLIHEMTIYEGVQMKLLAPVRATAVEVDAGRSHVRLVAGDYDRADIGLVMSRAPLLKAIESFRYDEENAPRPALIACATRAQAMAVFEYLAEHRPEGTPCPAPVLGDISNEMREAYLRHFENGVLDTLITVGVLIEGWSSVRCKLLIDAAPSLSMVRAAQKFTRPMTKDGDEEARIVMLIPSGLRYLPVLPLDVFGPAADDLDAPAPAPRPPRNGVSDTRRPSAWTRLREAGVTVRSIEAHTQVIEDMLIDRVNVRKGVQTVRRLVREQFGRFEDTSMVTMGRFMRTRFRIDEVVVSGAQLLRFLGCTGRGRGSTTAGFHRFLERYFPKVAADRLLAAHGHEGAAFVVSLAGRRKAALSLLDAREREEFIPTQTAYADKEWLHELERPAGLLLDVPSDGVWPLCRGSEETRAPDDLSAEREWAKRLERLLGILSPREVNILHWRFGLNGEDALTLQEAGDKLNLSRDRIRQIQDRSLAKLRERLLRQEKSPGSHRRPQAPDPEPAREMCPAPVTGWEAVDQDDWRLPECAESLSLAQAHERYPALKAWGHPAGGAPFWLSWKQTDFSRLFGGISEIWAHEGRLFVIVHHPSLVLRRLVRS